LASSRVYTTLDMKSSFWQSEIRESDRDKTAFITRKGQSRYKVLPSGLVNAPSLFQRLMSLVLAGLTWKTCLCYADDIILMAVSFEQMVERLDEVLGSLHAANLKLKASKCRLFQDKMNFLGHVVSKDGIEADPEKVRERTRVAGAKERDGGQEFRGVSGLLQEVSEELLGCGGPTP